MKRIFTCLIAAALAAGTAMATDVPEREHRAVWMTPTLGNNWPSSAITTGNASGLQNILRNRMAKFKAQNINVVYYHVRSFCDAMYKSSYEPWSSAVSPVRGQEPAFDPFEFLVKTAHEYGIEVYAWVNPYRYSNSTATNPYGDNGGNLNYENSHPEWLLRNSTQTVLNPGLPEVRQRIVDVISEVVRNYDVDGVIFDDYFYPSGGTSTTSSAPDYALWQQRGGGLSLADWRRKNVNDMVHDVNAAIKAIKPYVVFGISPAGVASGATAGLSTPTSEWQYNQIYSDPMAWYKDGTVDFISPQIYWPNRFAELTQWWSDAAVKYGRHVYPSVDITALSTYKTQSFLSQTETARSICPAGTSGIVFFQYDQFINYNERLFSKMQPFGENFRDGVAPTKALTPLRAWDPTQKPVFTSNVAIDGTTLTWTEVPGMRYTVYAHSKAEAEPFAIDIADLHGISYTNSYALPTDAADYDWYVAVYDRFGNEFAPLGVGQTPQEAAKAPVLTSPAQGSTPLDLFEFAWTSELGGKFTVELSRNQDFTDLVGVVSTGNKKLSVTNFPGLEAGKTYYWRVRLSPVGANPAVSAVQSFVAPRIGITAPADAATGASVTPTITWSRAVDGATYKLEVSTAETFSSTVVSTELTDSKYTVPAKLLTTGTKYYVRVTATLGENSSQSATTSFTTADRSDYTAPELLNPATDGQTMHSNEYLTVADWDGMTIVQVQVSASSTFPARSSYTLPLKNFASRDAQLSSAKISGKALVDGTTYYVRVRGGYNLTTKAGTNYTAYGPTRTFVYSSAAGVDDVTADSDATVSIVGGVVNAPAGAKVSVYAADGRLVASGTATAGSYSLPDASGVYVVTVDTNGARKALKYVK